MALNLGLNVLLEKPMVTTVEEAQALQKAQQESGKELVVAYQGGLSPLVHQLKKDIKLGTYGPLVSLSANIWENWADTYSGHWKQMPEISGGGFMFDTGAHLMNTTSMLCDKEFASISALMQNRGKPVDIVTAVMGQLTDGTLFTMQACGETIGCTSRIECYFSHHIIRICAWGRWMEIEDKEGNVTRQEQESANNLINIFQQTLKGEMDNPSSIQQVLQMARLWDAIKESASNKGQAVFLD
jgi:predicted dehydrogenase